jgi:hypothetical protein
MIVGCGGSDSRNGSQPAAATPEEAVRQLHAAFQSGDSEALAAVMAPPWDEFSLDMSKHPKQFAEAQADLEAALKKAFGPRHDDSQLAFGSKLADSLLGDLKRDRFEGKGEVMSMTIVDQTQEKGHTLLTVEIKEKRNDTERTEQQKFVATQHDGAWKLAPADVKPDGLLEERDNLKKLLETFATVSGEVRDGKFAARWEAERFITWSLLGTQPWLTEGPSPPEEFLADFVALGLARDEGPSIADPFRLNVRVAKDQIELRMASDVDWRGATPKELTAAIEQSNSASDDGRATIWLEAAPEASNETLLAALGAILDASSDVPRVALLFPEQRFKQLEPELVGRLRLFTMRIAPRQGDGAGEELKLEEMPEDMLDPSLESNLEPSLDSLESNEDVEIVPRTFEDGESFPDAAPDSLPPSPGQP